MCIRDSCNAIYQKLLSHTSEDVLHEESESVIMRHEAKEKQRGRKKITIAVLVSIALCIIAIFTALFLLPINIAYEPVKIDFPFEVEDVESVEMYHLSLIHISLMNRSMGLIPRELQRCVIPYRDCEMNGI